MSIIRESIEKILALNEAEDYTNISIKNVNKVITEKNVSELLKQKTEVYGKYDGTKLSIFRTDADWDPEDWTKMFVVSYKGFIIYPGEFDHIQGFDLDQSIGVSQYADVIAHVQKYFKEWKSVPKNFEFFLEYLMNKPTLTRQYTKIRQLILIGTAKASGYKIYNGKIKINSGKLDLSDREKWAKVLKVNLPEKIFVGILKKLPSGLNDRAKQHYAQYKETFDAVRNKDDWDYWQLCEDFFLTLPSLYGSEKEEGVVIHLSKSIKNTDILKIVQPDQYDKDLRRSIKMKYRLDDINSEDEYWKRIKAEADKIIEQVGLGSSLNSTLSKISKIVYKEWKPTFTHAKKKEINIRDDLFLTTKNKTNRLLPGNNGALVVGKFRVFTNGHKKMFDQALKTHDYLVVALVSNKETKKTIDLREKMIKAVYPDVEIIKTTSGNLITIINKSQRNINTVFAGSDRVDAYKNQLKRSDVKVEEIKRTDSDESATKVIRNLADKKYFKANTPREIHKFYDELVKTYGLNENFRGQIKIRKRHAS